MYFKPRVIEVKAGETVRFVLKNEGKLLHEFNLGDAAMHAEHQKRCWRCSSPGCSPRPAWRRWTIARWVTAWTMAG